MLPDIRPGNTKILYFFNCLLDGMHTKIKHICDFSRGGLNTCLYTLVSKPCSEATNMLYLASGVLLVGSSENQLERFGEEDRRCRTSSIGLTLESMP